MPSAGINEILPEVFEGNRLGAKYMNTLAALAMRGNKFHRSNGMHTLSNGAGDFAVPEDQTGVLFYNGDGTTVPAYGVILRNGVQNIDAIKAKQPDTYGCQENFLINSGDAVDGTDYGFAQEGFGNLFIAAYNSSDGTPALGEMWGPMASGYLLRKGGGGFIIEGIYDSTNHYAWVRSVPMHTVRGKPTADVASGASGTLTIYTGAYGSETQPVTNPTISNVRNDSSCTVKGSQITRARINPDINISGNPWQFMDGRTS